MQRDEHVQFQSMLTNVYAYYRREVTPFLLDVFWNGLSRFEFDDVQRAFDVHAQDPDRGQFPPLVSDITRLLEGSTQSQGMRAWAKVEKAIRSVGQYQSVAFDDPLIHAVIDEMGGWAKLCNTLVQDLPFRARDFERSYAAYRLRREVPPYPPRLVGVCEAENRMHGKPVAPPILVGEPNVALAVIERGSRDATLRITDAGTMARNEIDRIGGKHAA